MGEADPVGSLRRVLLAWYDAHARDLPWRRTDDPYAVWVSEVMLQQTRVDTVVPYWERWMDQYPDVETLAAADLDDVLKSWEGLGYYRRARSLHRAAGVVRDGHGGEVPETAAALRELPGIGEYTAGAVASIAFGEPRPAVDGNVRRVLARLFDLPSPTAADLRGRAAALVDPNRPGDFNQALMELGATVCTPSSPQCSLCPLEAPCLARQRDVQEERPRPRERGPVPERRYGVAVLARRHGTPPSDRADRSGEVGVDGAGGVEVLLVRRPREGLLGGLWEFPTGQVRDGSQPLAAALRAVAFAWGGTDGDPLEDPSPRALDEVRHAYSHFLGRYQPFLVELSSSPGSSAGADARWVPLADLGGLPVPVAQQRIAGAARDALA